MNSDYLRQLQALLDERRDQGDAQASYVASLHAAGLNRILEKLGEECTETLLAAKDCAVDGNTSKLVHETADLWFHSLVMLSHLGSGADAVIAELARRGGMSGHEEKANRGGSSPAAGKEN